MLITTSTMGTLKRINAAHKRGQMYHQIVPPSQGEKIQVLANGQWIIPNEPIIAFIEGDGVGSELTPLMRQVIDSAILKTYETARKIHWLEVYNGEKAAELYDGDWFPEETLNAIRDYHLVYKGPLTTAMGAGFRSLNVALRHEMDLFINIRPIKSLPNLNTPVKHPENIDMVIFRDNSEDLYSGIEFKAGSAQADSLLEFLQQQLGVNRFRFTEQCGLGIKHISEQGSKRLVRAAIAFALKEHKTSVTLVHKGDVMKFTDGAFLKWALEVAIEEFLAVRHPNGRWWQIMQGEHELIIKDELCDVMLQNCLLAPEQYDVIATTNLNGDLLVDSLTAQVGMIGMAAGANLSEALALFEPTHGTVESLVGQDVMNPVSSILAGVMMLRFMNWHDAADNIEQSLHKTLRNNQVTEDMQSLLPDPTVQGTQAFAQCIISHLI